MYSVRTTLTLLLVLLVGLFQLPTLGNSATFQEETEEKSDKSESNQDQPQLLRRIVDLDFLYRLNEQGELVPSLIGIDLEELERIIKEQSSSSADDEKNLTFDNIDVLASVDANSNFATLTLTCKTRLSRKGWNRIPLSLSNLLLDKVAAKGLSEKDFFVAFDKEKDQFILWANVAAAKNYEFKLTGFRSIQSNSEKSTLKLRLPNSRTNKIKLNVPKEVEFVPVADNNSVFSNEKSQQEKSSVEIRAWKGQLDVSWRDKDDGLMEVKPSIFAKSNVVATIESQTNLSLNAEFNVNSFGAKLSSVNIKLPAGAELIPVDQLNYSIGLLSEEQIEGKKVQTVRVSLLRETANPEPISLQAELNTTPDEPIEFSGFEVLGAVRQTGSLDIVASEEWSIIESNSLHAKRVTIPGRVREIGQKRTRYRIEKHPFELAIRVAQTPSRIIIKPLHVATISKRQIQLECRWTVSLEGPAPESLKFKKGSWVLDGSVTPSNYVDDANYDGQNNENLVIRLSEFARSSRTEFELRAVFKRPLENDSVINFSLPASLQGISEPSRLIANSSQNIQLSIDESSLIGLESFDPAAISETEALPAGALMFREKADADATDLRFISDYTVRNREIQLSGTATLIPKRNSLQVVSQFEGEIQFVPIENLLIRLPNTLTQTSELQILVNGESVNTSLQDLAVPAPNQNTTLKMIQLSRPLIGELNVELSYKVPLQFNRLELRTESLNLFLPSLHMFESSLGLSPFSALQWIQNFPTVKLSDPLSVQTVTLKKHDSSAIFEIIANEEDSNQEDRDGDKIYRIANLNFGSNLALKITKPRFLNRQARMINRLYCQTVLARKKRFDYVAIKFVAADQIELQIPKDAELTSSYIDGRSVEPSSLSSESLLFKLQPPVNPQEIAEEIHVVEVTYESNSQSTQNNYVQCQLPSVKGVGWAESIYWELLMPSDQHFISAQEGMVPALEMDWSKGLLQRRAAVDHSSLEIWFGIPLQPMPTADNCNRYVFSSFGPVDQFSVFVLSRRELILISAAFAFLLGAVFVAFPLVRHPVNLILLTIALVILSLRLPDLAIVVFQVLFIAIALGVVIFLVQRSISKREFNLQRSIRRQHSVSSAQTES